MMTIKISNYDYLLKSKDFDIIHDDYLYLEDKLLFSSVVEFENKHIVRKLLFNHKNDDKINEDDFLFIGETNILFFVKSCYESWAAFDLMSSIIIRKESAMCMDGIERIKDRVVIYEELISECTDLYGNRIDTALSDPPCEMKKFENRIEFITCDGPQILDFKL